MGHVHMHFLLYLSSLLWFNLHNHQNNRFSHEIFFMHICMWMHTWLTPPNIPWDWCIFSNLKPMNPSETYCNIAAQILKFFMHRNRILHIPTYIGGAYIFCITNITLCSYVLCSIFYTKKSPLESGAQIICISFCFETAKLYL